MEARLGADVRLGGAWTSRQRFKNDLIYRLVRCWVGFAARAPRWLVRGLVAFVVHAAWVGSRTLRGRVSLRLEVGLGRRASFHEVRRAFAEAGAALASMALLFRADEEAGAELEIDEASSVAFRSALAAGRGVVYVTAHLGPWERMAALLVERGFPVATVARESYDPRLTAAVYERIRAPRGVRSIYRGELAVAVRIARELQRGGAVGFLVDLPARGVATTRAPLFGAPADVALGPARIALALGASVVVGTTAGGRVTVRRVASADLAPGAAGERELTLRMAAELDRRIQEAPTAWLGLWSRGE